MREADAVFDIDDDDLEKLVHEGELWLDTGKQEIKLLWSEI